MLKDVGMVVLKIKEQDCNNPSGAQWTTDYDMTIHNLCMQEMILKKGEIMRAWQWQTNNITGSSEFMLPQDEL